MYDLVVIGGGPAGTAAAITAARSGGQVVLLERGRYPRHKVCGEFVSPEALELLASLLPESKLLRDAPRIACARLFLDGRMFAAALTPAAASIARIDLDDALWRAAGAHGVECRQRVPATEIRRSKGEFVVATSCGELNARTVVDASGRWSELNRSARPARGWLGLKAHFICPVPQDSTDLYFFPGGYCGVQPVAGGGLNICAMVRPETATTLSEVFARHQRLAETSREWHQLTETVATSPLIFRRTVAEHNGVLRAGDAAGFIDPFAGDGISLALQSGVLAGQVLSGVWQGEAELAQIAHLYRTHHERRFGPAFRSAARFRRLLALPAALRAPVLPLLRIPAVSSFVVKKTRAA